eukprot:TRINITY_DN9477_c0_g1_i4.p1 TRINITY_DN9477_c0_g1~~TRINITY_DN9477_c0_g1_i4.p1  ORF type:complete len:239 (-),score=44.56 TRINITY_DN9477_c0_g1_i4:544-1260(-)
MGFGGLINPTRVTPNFIARGTKKSGSKFVGEEIHFCQNYSKLVFKRPFDRGYLLDWETEKQIWALSETYAKIGKKFSPRDTDLLLTEAYFNPESLRRNLYEIIYEDYQFKSLCTMVSAALALRDANLNRPEFLKHPGAIVVDTGYSFTHVVPFFDHTKLTYAIRRIDVGGKLLTNYLKEIISHRYWNIMDETYLTNHIKERLCYVSQDFKRDLMLCKKGSKGNTVRRAYVLPDSSHEQ